ncbi:MAG: class I SAM-dependent methyltransferase [Verrucomicrobia bacterium]|nr:class I SAM-dependent methyltransferase [Verrucomicrobiota bacterium]
MRTHDDPLKRTPFDDGQLYDALCSDLRFGLDYYLDLARRADGPVLDVACGTGRIMIPCAQAGVDIEGVDLSPAMLEHLREKARLLGLKPLLHQADMRGFRLPRRFALIMIPFNSFVHNLTMEAQIDTLRCCYDHLIAGGMLAFDAFFPGLEIIGSPDNTRVLELETKHPKHGRTLRLFDTRSFDRVAQLQKSLIEVEELDERGAVAVTHRSATTIRWIYKSEMQLLLTLAGFGRRQIYGNFDRQPLTRETDAMIVEAWRT